MALDRIVGIVMALILLTALSVVISRRANTAAVVNSIVGGFQKVQQTAISPVTK